MNRAERIAGLSARAYTIPTDRPESDGTIEWHSTTIVVAEVRASDATGIGYAYGSSGAVAVVHESLKPVVVGADATDLPSIWMAMTRAVRNIGRSGVASAAISAVDVALWDLKAKLLDVPLVTLLGRARDSIPAYGSGGFTSYSIDELRAQLAAWAGDGIRAVKMKVGREPDRDRDRVAAARAAIGPSVELFVDANGAYAATQAARMAEAFAEHDVTWFEEPVSSDNLQALRELRARMPAGMRVAAGEYGYDAIYFRRMLEARG